MEKSQIETSLIDALLAVAPEIERDEIEADTDIRNDLDIDSVDYLNFIIKIKEQLGVEIPETDYGKLSTIKAAIAYLEQRLR